MQSKSQCSLIFLLKKLRATDIDECLDKEKYHCEGKCKNTIGSYTCDCPIGMYGDGKVDCRGFHITTIVAGDD